MSEPRSSPRVTVSVFGLTDMGRVRTNNEDAFLISPLADAGAGAEIRSAEGSPGGGPTAAAAPTEPSTFEAGDHAVLLAVSDGMGGADAGEVASALVIESLRRAMVEAEGKLDWDAATKQAVERANHEVWSAARAPGRKGMGATVTAVCVQGDHAHIAEVGDSRAYLLRNARIRQMTHDQSFVQYLVDAGALKPEEAANYPMKNVVLQAMGQKPDVQVALGRLELRRGDKLLLCSDGLSGKLKSEEMLAVVKQAPSLEAACREMVDLANARGGEDNITVILAHIDGEGLSEPREQETLTQTFEVLAEYKAAGSAIGEDARDEEDEEEREKRARPAKRSAGGSAKRSAAVQPVKPAAGVNVRLLAVALLVGVAVAAVVLVLQRL